MKTKKNGATRQNFYNQSVNRLIRDTPYGSTIGKNKGEILPGKILVKTFFAINNGDSYLFRPFKTRKAAQKQATYYNKIERRKENEKGCVVEIEQWGLNYYHLEN